MPKTSKPVASSHVTLAVHGGEPVRRIVLPYAKQSIDDADVRAVTDTLKSDWLTTGPKIAEFESLIASHVGGKYAVAVSSGTAALHAAFQAVGIGKGDEVIVPALTFAASANAVVYNGGTPVFCDINAETHLIDPKRVREKITPKTKAILAVDFGGQPCEYDELKRIAADAGVVLVADACHSLGATYQGQKVGTIADLTVFSFHPAKHLTTGEGGMIVTNSPIMAERMRRFRNHGITTDVATREKKGTFFYEMETLGFNYRITDIQCALGISQFPRLTGWIERRQRLAAGYDRHFSGNPLLRPLRNLPDVSNAYHLYVVRLSAEKLSGTRQDIYTALRAEGIGVNVHYVPVHLHPYYRRNFNTRPGQFPEAEAAYETSLSLPLFASMNDQDQRDVLQAMDKVLSAYGR